MLENVVKVQFYSFCEYVGSCMYSFGTQWTDSQTVYAVHVDYLGFLPKL